MLHSVSQDINISKCVSWQVRLNVTVCKQSHCFCQCCVRWLPARYPILYLARALCRPAYASVISDCAHSRCPGRPPSNAPAEAETGSVQCDAGADCSIQHGLHR